MSTKTLCGADFSSLLRSGAAGLNAHRTLVNDLNVFPIPDGDTGDNMYMTIQAGCDAIAHSDVISVSQLAKEASSGMLLGARGNSGVILSRIFAGFAKGAAGHDTLDMPQFACAMSAAVKEAYSAVANPVEGTILTVIREAVSCAGEAGAVDFQAYFDALLDGAQRSLDNTPNLLDVLKEAGVVDSGGAGLVYIIEGMKASVYGEALENGAETAASSSSSSKIDLSAFTEDSVLEFGYCTEFLLRLQSSKVDLADFDESVIREYLEGAGESLVFFRDGSIIKVHVHTHTPGDILNTCQKWGEFLSIKIENMTLQHHENRMEEKLSARKGPRKNVAIIAVASGEGLAKVFSDMGALVVEGGQTMNPSAEDFINAFNQANAEKIFVLPNNSNIVLTARQAASMYDDSQIYVLPTVTIGGGYSVLGSIDFASDPSQVEAQAQEIIDAVVTGMVSKAIRDTKDTKTGDYIGFTKKEILCDSSDRKQAFYQLCEKMPASDYDIVIVFKGCDVPSQEAEEVGARLQSLYPRTEIVMMDGGQPVYDYILIFE